MGAKNSKVKKGGAGEGPADTVDKTATLPASFRQKEEAAMKTETLPRNLNRSTSFTESCRNWAKKKGLVKDKNGIESKTEIIEKEIESKPTENGNGTTLEIKEVAVTPSIENNKAVTKLAQKKARAQFFEDMYNSSGLSVSSALTPEKPKRLCDMNLPSPRIGPGSPQTEKLEGKVELLAKQIEEKEKLNKSLEEEVSSLNKSIDSEVVTNVVEEKSVVEIGTMETTSEKISEHKQEILEHTSISKQEIEVTKKEVIEQTSTSEQVIEVTNKEVLETISTSSEVKEVTQEDGVEKESETVKEEGILKVKEILESSHDQDVLDETLPSTARLEQPFAAAEHIAQDIEKIEETKEHDINDEERIVMDTAALEPSSLESVGTDDDDETKIVENGKEEREDSLDNVINNGDNSSEEEGASTDEGYDDDKKGGAEELKKILKNKSEVDESETSASLEHN